jgi:rod shape-determining protein MreC
MFTLNRWWNRYRLQAILIGLAVGSAAVIRQTNGAVLFESYHLLSGVFRPNPTQGKLLANAQFDELQQRLTELESQNQRMRDLLGYTSEVNQKGTPAAIVGRSSDHWWQQVILGRGSQSGIKVGDIVRATGGLIGRVTDVTQTTSRVLLLSDPTSRVGAMVSRSRVMGYVRGKTSNRLTMEFFDKAPDVRKGDVIVTSSLSQLFPAGVPIGRVESIDLSKSLVPKATIELSAPVSSLEWAVVYPFSPSTQPLPVEPGQKSEPLQ